jgi:hypothetical protein
VKAAFKEWAVVCRALGRGKQVVILRKGGIIEEGGEFKPDRPEFLLFPTYSHQSPDDVVAEARPWLLELEDEQPETGTIAFHHYAVITDALRVKSLDAVLRLRGQHIWSDDVVEERFHRWKDSIYALVVRVYALPKPASVEMLEDYTGCKSWVDLAVDISTEGSTPVVGESEFAKRAVEIRAALLAK